MNKPELIAALNELSGKLGRELRTEGSNAELQARLDEGLVELSMLEDGDTEAGHSDTFGGDAIDSDPADTTLAEAADGSVLPDHLRQFRLLTTMHIRHYQPREKVLLGTYRCISSIVRKDSVVLISPEDADVLVSLGYAEAV